MANLHVIKQLLIAFIVCTWTVPSTKCGIPIPGLQHGPTPFQSLFATGFGGSYNTFGSGTVAGAIGNYGRFVSGGASSNPHGGGGYGRK